MASMSNDLPHDMIFEVLTRTTLRTLDLSRCVSKAWNDAIEEPAFTSKHCRRTNSFFGFFIQSLSRHRHVSMFASTDESTTTRLGRLPEGMRILASSKQGVLCCAKRMRRDYRYYICKPVTGQWQELPDAEIAFDNNVAVGMVVSGSRPLRFKIVRLSKKGIAESEEEDDWNYRCEMFDSEMWAWREGKPPKLSYLELIHSTTQPIFVKRSIHWLTTDNNVLTFYEPTESFQTHPLPEPMCNEEFEHEHKPLVDYKGRLGVMRLVEEEIELWLDEADDSMTPNNNQIEWRRHLVIDIGNLEGSLMQPSLVGLYDGRIILLRAFNEVLFYDIRHGIFRKVKLDDRLRVADEIFPFRSDSERVCFRALT